MTQPTRVRLQCHLPQPGRGEAAVLGEQTTSGDLVLRAAHGAVTAKAWRGTPRIGQVSGLDCHTEAGRTWKWTAQASSWGQGPGADTGGVWGRGPSTAYQGPLCLYLCEVPAMTKLCSGDLRKGHLHGGQDSMGGRSKRERPPGREWTLGCSGPDFIHGSRSSLSEL